MISINQILNIKNILLITILFYFGIGYAFAELNSTEQKVYKYSINSGDILGEIALIFTGNAANFLKIAKENNIKNYDFIYPGEIIKIYTQRPVAILRQYLSSIYNFESSKAYSMLALKTKSQYSLSDFIKATNEMTYYDLGSIELIKDIIKDGKRIVLLNVQIEEDPGSWGFDLIWEVNEWRILLFDLNPTFPQKSIISDE